MKLNHLLDKGDISASECVIGFVAYDKTAKTTSCINAFYLGVERVCSQSSILVRYVGKEVFMMQMVRRQDSLLQQV